MQTKIATQNSCYSLDLCLSLFERAFRSIFRPEEASFASKSYIGSWISRGNNWVHPDRVKLDLYTSRKHFCAFYFSHLFFARRIISASISWNLHREIPTYFDVFPSNLYQITVFCKVSYEKESRISIPCFRAVWN